MTCKINYKGDEFKSEQDLEQALEGEMLQEAMSYSLYDSPKDNRDLHLADKFHLNNLGNGEYAANLRQLNAIKTWIKKDENNQIKFNTRLYAGTTGKFIVSFTMPGFTPEIDRKYQAAQKPENSEAALSQVLSNFQRIFPGLKFKFIDAQDLKAYEHIPHVDRIRAFVRNGDIEMVRGRVDLDSTLEELLHPFVNNLYDGNRTLFDNLLREGKQLDPDFFQQIVKSYVGTTAYKGTDVNKEFVTQMMQKVLRGELKDAGFRGRSLDSFKELIRQFFVWMTGVMKDIVHTDHEGNSVVEIDEIPSNMTFREVSQMINTKGVTFNLNFATGKLQYNLKENTDVSSDHIFSSRGSRFKRDRAGEDVKNVEKHIKSQLHIGTFKGFETNQAQVKTLEILKSHSEGNWKFYDESAKMEDNKRTASPTVSVSAFIGSSQFTSLTDYTKFKDFGIFFHAIIESVQNLANESNKLYSDIVTREYYDQFVQEYILDKHNKDTKAFDIENLSSDEMFEMVKQFLSSLGTESGKGYIFIPEYTVTARQKGQNPLDTHNSGRLLVGRLDLLVIDLEGRVRIIDVKTKKVHVPIVDTITGNSYVAFDAINAELVKPKSMINSASGTDPEFQTEVRSVFDTWNAQLIAYEHILTNMGLEVVSKDILSLVYRADENQKYQDSAVIKFEGDFYAGADRNRTVTSGQPVGYYQTLGEEKRAKYKKIFERILPLTVNQQQQIKDNEQRQGFDMNPRDYAVFITNVKDVVDKDLDVMNELRFRRVGEHAEEEEITMIDARVTALKAYAMEIADGNNAITSMKLSLIMQAMEKEMGVLTQTWKDAIEDITEENKNVRSRQMLVFNDILMRSSILVDFLKKQIDAAVSDETSTITTESLVYKRINEMDRHISRMDAQYKEYAARQMLVIFTDGTSMEGIRNTIKDLTPHLNLRIAAIDKQLAHIEAEDIFGTINILKTKGLKIFHKKGYEAMKQEMGKQGGTAKADAILQLEATKLKIIALRDLGLDMTNEKMMEYILGVTNPNTLMYLGVELQDQLVDALGMNLRGFSASAGSSDLGIASFTGYLKKALFNAGKNFWNSIQASGLQAKQDALLNQSGSTEKMNAALIEVRTKIITDKEGKTTELKTNSFAVPSSQAFTDKFDLHVATLRQNKNETDLVKQEYFTLIKNKDRTGAVPFENRILELYNKKHAIMTEQLKWLRENTSLPYIDAYYENRELLPEVYRGQLDLLYLQREGLLNSEGPGNEETLDEDSQFEAEQIRVKIQRLRKEASGDKEIYATFIDNLELMYESVEKTAAFQREKASKQSFYGEDKEGMQKWMESNTVTVATQAYWDRVKSLNEELAEIYGNTERYKELSEERIGILRVYKTEDGTRDLRLNDGNTDMRDMLQNDIDRLTVLDEELLTLRTAQNENRGRLSPQDQIKSKALRDELTSIQKKVVNKYYAQEKQDMTTTLLNKRAALIQEQKVYDSLDQTGFSDEAQMAAGTNYNIAYLDYKTSEKIFKVWYDTYHTKSYALGTVYSRPNDLEFSTVKSYLYDSVPSRPEHLMSKPNSKWYYRKLKPEASNPDYKVLPDGSPMPKGLDYDAKGNVYILPGQEANPNINLKFAQIQSDAVTRDYYNDITKMYLDRQEVIHGKKNGYKIPGTMGSTVENFMEFGLKKGIEKEFNKGIDSLLKTRSEQDQINNTFGDMGQDHVQLVGNEQFTDEVQGSDSVGAVMKWLYESHVNEAMADAQPVTKHVLNLVAQQFVELTKHKGENADYDKRLRELTNAQDILQFEYRKFISGQTESTENRALKKAMSHVFKIASIGRLGFDVTAQVKNMVSGNIQAFLAASGSGIYSNTNWSFAVTQMNGSHGFMHKYIADWGRFGGLSKETLLFRIYNPMQTSQIKNLYGVSNSRTRRALEKATNINELMFILQEKGDMQIGMLVWLATMDAHKYRVMTGENFSEGKLDAKGNQIYVNALDAYELGKGGQLVIRGDVEFSNQDENSIQRKVNSEMRRAQGNYAKADMTRQEERLIVKMMFFFRKYLVPMVANRVGVGRPNWEGEQGAMGYWRVMYNVGKYYGAKQFAQHLFLGGFSKKAMGHGLDDNPLYQRKAVQASKDLYVNLVLISLSYMLMGMVKGMKDDDEEISVWFGNFTRLVWGVQQEATSMTPIPGIGSFDDYIKNFSQVTTTVTDFTKLYKAVEHGTAMGLLWAYDFQEPDPDINPISNFFYNRATYQAKTGRFEAGTPKFYKDIYDLSGYKNIDGFINPKNKLVQASKNI